MSPATVAAEASATPGRCGLVRDARQSGERVGVAAPDDDRAARRRRGVGEREAPGPRPATPIVANLLTCPLRVAAPAR